MRKALITIAAIAYFLMGFYFCYLAIQQFGMG